MLIGEDHPEFSQTGLRKTSLIRADKVATVNESVFQKQLGVIPLDVLALLRVALKMSLNMS